jgi:GntR family transcriptional regulator / MocR family aminotransferase
MKRRHSGALLVAFRGPANDDLPLYQRICRAVREAVARGALSPGDRLPSARTLAVDLGVARSTVEAALAELDAEGLVVRKVGAGTFVSRIGAERDAAPRRSKPVAEVKRSRARGAAALSERGRGLLEIALQTAPTQARAFTPCLPGLDVFPFEQWNRILARRARTSGAALAGAMDPPGLPMLREAVAAYLGASRGVRCDPAQVIVTTSTQQSLTLSARALVQPGSVVWLEDPGYAGARAAFEAARARLVPVPVDEEGLCVAVGRAAAPEAVLVYVTPSYQYPLGVTMSARRRDELVRWAAESGAWILEDDYDCEFRFAVQPLAAMQGSDFADRVLYAGTFNKILFPSLRISYLVVPHDLVEPFVLLRSLFDGPVPALQQAAVADFIAEGHFSAHVRRMRSCYEERRSALIDGLARDLPGRLEVRGSETGLHVAGLLPPGEGDVALSERAAARGLDVPPLTRYFLGPPRVSGLVLSYAAATPAEIRSGVRTLASCFDS